MPYRITLTAILVFSTLPVFAESTTRPQARQPNILWIVGENMKLDLGCYGAKNVATPNLDRLAAEGVRYTRVFATSPVCAPSRSAFMTGMYQTSTDMHHMRSHRDDDYRLPPGVRPITHRLRDAGYRTANITKIGDRVVGTGKLDLNFVNEGPVYDTDNWAELKSKQPFLAQINTPEIEYDIYDRKTAEKPRVEWVGEQDHPQIATPENVTPPPYYPDHRITREEWARYLNSVSGMDRRVGWILEQLKRDGLEDDTVVIFFADNGRLEARGIHWCYDTGLHVPMIIRWPKNFPAPAGYEAGTVNDQVISLLDLTATTLAIAGISRPPGMQSRIFLGPDADPPRQYAFSARDRIDETVNRIRSVRGPRYHYLRNYMPKQSFASLNRYKEKCFAVKPLMRQMFVDGTLKGPAADLFRDLPPEQLYDTQSDPHEIRNIAESTEPEHRAALLRLRTALDVWLTETGDLGEQPEPPEVVAPFLKEMHDWFGTPKWAEEQEQAQAKQFSSDIHAAISRSIPLLEQGAAGSAEHRECFTCHNQAMPVLACVAARDRGFQINEANLQRQIQHTIEHLKRGRKNYKEGRGQGGRGDTAGYALWTLEAGDWTPDETTELVSSFLLKWQKKAGHFPRSGNRPPSEASHFTTTYLAVRGLGVFGSESQQEQVTEGVASARKWLLKTTPVDTEDRVFRLRGLGYTDAPQEAIRAAADELLATQRPDGGWAQLTTLTSDAYATGSALVALHEAGRLTASSPAYEHGVRFLLKNQLEDGSWYVPSRSKPFQEYFETGFPHDTDQFISSSASAWATLALLLTIPEVAAKPAALDAVTD